MKPKNIAAAIPPAVACKPPVKIPKMPFALTAFIAPFANDAPNPIIGTLIPAPNNEASGSKSPKPASATPIISNKTKILAVVIFVFITSICPIKQISPPNAKTIK